MKAADSAALLEEMQVGFILEVLLHINVQSNALSRPPCWRDAALQVGFAAIPGPITAPAAAAMSSLQQLQASTPPEPANESTCAQKHVLRLISTCFTKQLTQVKCMVQTVKESADHRLKKERKKRREARIKARIRAAQMAQSAPPLLYHCAPQPASKLMWGCPLSCGTLCSRLGG